MSNMQNQISIINSYENEFRPLKASEIELINIILKKNIKAHNNDYCFCDKYNNLYTIQVKHRIASISFIRSKVSKINNTKELGFYEPCFKVYESIEDLFSHFPVQ